MDEPCYRIGDKLYSEKEIKSLIERNEEKMEIIDNLMRRAILRDQEITNQRQVLDGWSDFYNEYKEEVDHLLERWNKKRKRSTIR